MNRLLLTILALVVFTYTVTAGDAPAAAEKALSEKFPKAEEVTWQKESANNFRAEFIFSGTKMWVNFNEDGKWIQTKTTTSISTLPDGIGDFIKKNYPGGSIQKAAKVERAAIDVVLYELEIKTGSKTNVELLTADGRKIK